MDSFDVEFEKMNTLKELIKAVSDLSLSVSDVNGTLFEIKEEIVKIRRNME